ncbi:MAG TPA: DegT/DnrJ/EryC1/StrS family aminotransferase [Candidatus Hydrogenedentes bacterium]|nr:DegT/DnrJ/EryC1/StrS family aminotransferase [Candidatus Hydrogenedentota bacterium]
MAVPLVDLGAQYVALKTEIEAVVSEVFETQGFVGGPFLEGFERAMGEYLNGVRCVGVASGTDALLLTLRAAGIGPGDEVITSPFTFFATAGAVANVGAIPVFVDIEPDTFNIDVVQIESKITERTKALMPVHIFGQCADMDPVLALAERHGLRVIEDCAQALGARYKGRLACTLGDAAGVSFYPSKNLGGAGDGGMVAARDEELAERVRLLRNHGQDSAYRHALVGTNSRLDALQAAVLSVKLKHLDTWNAQRRERAAYYGAQLADVPEMVAPIERAGNYHVYHQYVVRLPARDRAIESLRAKGIGCAVFYPVPLHRQECFAHLGYSENDYPVAIQASREVLALPIYPELTCEQQDEVVAALKEHVAALPRI